MNIMVIRSPTHAVDGLQVKASNEECSRYQDKCDTIFLGQLSAVDHQAETWARASPEAAITWIVRELLSLRHCPCAK